MLVNIKKTELTEAQLKAIDLLVGRTESGKQMNKSEIAEACGVSRQSLYNWLKKQEFREELVKQAKTVTDSGLAASLTWMEQAMSDPTVKDSVKVKISELFMKNHGMLKEVQESTVKTDSNTDIDALMAAYGIKKKTE